jgi:hypothetical protein
MMTRCVVHIGFHKTGSTSIQNFLWQFRNRLATLGILFYEGQHIPHNHVELHIGAMAPHRMTPYKIAKGIAGGPAYREAVERRLADLAASAAGTLLFSSEGLSYLRYEDELTWLKKVLPGEVTVVAYLRKVEDYLQAYRHMLQKHKIEESDDKGSIAYLGENSWLKDYPARLMPFRRAFGEANVVVLDYDAEVADRGNVIPSFLRVLQIEPYFQVSEWNGIFLNKRPSQPAGG